jgi:hypothetical protein
MNELAELEARGELADHAGAKRLRPLEALPAEYRKPVGFFWALNKHLLPSPTPLVLRLQVWIAKEDLTPAEVRAVLNRLVSPEASAAHRFASDLLCDLAQVVADVTRARRQRQDQAEARRQAEADAAAAVPAPDLAKLLAGVGQRV